MLADAPWFESAPARSPTGRKSIFLASTILAVTVLSAAPIPVRAEPTEIDSIQQLDQIGVDPSLPLSGDYVLGENIDASGFSGFIPIGGSASPFTGTFDGEGHTISNLSIKSNASGPGNSGNVGLFSQLQGSISNLRLLNETVMATGSGINLGGLVGLNDGTIDNTRIDSGAMTYSDSNRTVYASSVGGLVGANWYSGSILSSSANITTTGTNPGSVANRVGGLVGTNGGRIGGSHASGTLGAAGADWLGGLVGGTDTTSTISQSYATGSVHVSEAGLAGGLVGSNDTGSISQSFATGDVSSGNTAGGLVGDNYTTAFPYPTISQSYATGNVSISGKYGAAGALVGIDEYGSTVQSYATGFVSATSGSAFVGGFAGYGDNPNPGGYAVESYWDTHSTGQAVGTGGGNDLGAIGLNDCPTEIRHITRRLRPKRVESK